MPKKSFLRPVCSLLLTILSATNAAFAFDTAPHYDLTRAVLAERRFAEASVKIAQVENWLTDYYSSSPTISKSKRAALEKLHFDNLYTTAEVKNYWAQFLANIRTAAREAAVADDAPALLAVLGASLHAVQDFYAHSNWVERHPRKPGAPYRTETFPSEAPAAAGIATGKYPADRKTGPNGAPVPAGALPHGGYREGLNHDSPVRAGWDEAYVFAYAASHELVELLEKWTEEARPGFWKKIREFQPAPEDLKKLEFDLKAAQNLSMWIKVRDADGHWKGDKSGLARFFDTFTSKWVGRDSSPFVKLMRDGKIAERLSENLYAPTRAPLPKTGRFGLGRRVVLVRTRAIRETTDVGRFEPRVDPSGSADFYALFRIGGQIYRERVMQDSKSALDPWFAIHFVDRAETSVSLNVAVLDEDDWDADGKYRDDEIDINPAAGKRDLDLTLRFSDNLLSGDLAGIHATRETAFTSTGAKPDKNRASIECYVWSVLLN